MDQPANPAELTPPRKKAEVVDPQRWDRDDWKRIYRNATDPEVALMKRMDSERKRRVEDRIADTGL